MLLQTTLKRSCYLHNSFPYEEVSVDLKRKRIKECVLSDLQKCKFCNQLKTCKSWNHKRNVESHCLAQSIQKTCVKLTEQSLYKRIAYIPVRKSSDTFNTFALKRELL